MLPALIHEQNTDSVISHLNYTIIINFVDNTSEKLEIFSFSEVLSTVKMPIANYAQTECQFRYCGTAIPFLTVRSTAR